MEAGVVGLELAMQIKEMNFKKESFFNWAKHKDLGWILIQGRGAYEEDRIVHAYTVAELGEIMKGRGMGVSAWSGIGNEWWIRGGVFVPEKQQYDTTITAELEADVRAKMLIHLIKEGIIKP